MKVVYMMNLGHMSSGQFFEEITLKNTVISPNFLVWTLCGKAQFPHSFGTCAFPQNLHTRKLGEITIFFAVDSVNILHENFESQI